MRIGVGLSIPELATRGGRAFSPASLFTSGVAGAWYDPSDYSTLYQDSAGTTPVTAVEQPVGLMLDKSQGLVLGSELVTNGDFATSSDWTLGSGWTISGGAAVATSAASGATVIQIQTEFVSGRLYQFTYTVVSVSAGGFSARFEGQTGTSRTTPGTYTEYFFSTGATQNSGVRANGTTTGSITNISVKEIAGNHASQATPTSRPVLRARKNWLVGTNTLATQTVTTRAIPYVLSFYGTGSITLSGTATATLNGTGVNDRVYVDVTPTAGTLTVTVTGTVTNAQLEFANEPA